VEGRGGGTCITRTWKRRLRVVGGYLNVHSHQEHPKKEGRLQGGGKKLRDGRAGENWSPAFFTAEKRSWLGGEGISMEVRLKKGIQEVKSVFEKRGP